MDMKRDWNQKVEEARVPITAQPSCHPFPKQRGEMNLPLIFPSVDQFLKSPFIIPWSPGCCDISLLGHANTTWMILNFLGSEGATTERTERGFDPMNLQKAIRTDSSVPLLQKPFTTGALGREEKLEEPFKGEMHDSVQSRNHGTMESCEKNTGIVE
jgi:hypothetical protein